MTKKRKFRYMICISIVLLFGLHTNIAHCQSNSQYSLEKSVINGGGGGEPFRALYTFLFCCTDISYRPPPQAATI